MVIVEKSFPRGGLTKESNTGETENIIFGAVQKKIKTKSSAKVDLSNTQEDTQLDHIETVSAELLSYETIQDGMNIMGIVKAVDPLYLLLSLPGRMTARVSALEISDAYTKFTQNFLKNTENIENYKSITDLYQIGQVVYGHVQEVKSHDSGRIRINMSLKPTEVHSGLQHVNIKKGFIFSGAVEEIQEHGIIIESGIKGMRAFLPLEESKIENYTVGELILLKVEKISHDKTVSTAICKEIKQENAKIKNQSEANIDYIMPSTIVQFNISKQLKDGLQGTVMNGAHIGYVNEHQLTEALSLPEDYEVNTIVQARVLYIMPLTKLIYLTLNLRNTAEHNDSVANQFKSGDIIENAKVHRMGTGGVVLVLNNKFKGILSYKTIKANYKGNYDQDELLNKYAKKTEHKVRVLGYDLMDSMYICTDSTNVVNEKVFSVNDLQPGEFTTVTVKNQNKHVGGYNVQVGKVQGIIEHLFLAPTNKPIEENSKVRCRVLAINEDRKTVYFTNRPEYMTKKCKILKSLKEAKPNGIYTGTIVKCEADYILVKFCNNIKGVLHKQQLNSLMAAEMDTFYEGQTMLFRILNKNDEQIRLSLADDMFSLGEICPVTVVNTLESGLEIKIVYHAFENDSQEEETAEMQIKGIVPIRLLSDYMDLIYAKLRMHPAGTQTQAVCIFRNTFSLRDVEYFQQHLTKDWNTVKMGDILKTYVKNVNEDVVELVLPIRDYAKPVKLHLKMLLVNAYKCSNVVLTPEQVLYVKVLGKEKLTKTLTVTAKLTDVWNGELSSTAQYLEKYLKEVSDIKKTLKKQGSHPIAQLTIGEKITASFKGVNAETNDWQYEIAKTKIQAIVKAPLVGKSKPPKNGAMQECIILWIDYSNELVFLSNKSSDIDHITNATKIPTNLVGKSGINGKILLILENVFICSLKKGPNPLIYCPIRLHFNDLENASSIHIKEGDFCKLAFIHESKPIAVLESTWKLWKNIKRKCKAEEEHQASNHKKIRLAKSEEEDNSKNVTRKKKAECDKVSIEKPADKKTENDRKRKLKATKQEANESKKVKKLNKMENLFYEDITPNEEIAKNHTQVEATEMESDQNKIAKTSKTKIQRLSGVANFWTTELSILNRNNDSAESSDDAENDTETSAPQRKKKLTSVEKFKLQREEEERLRNIEEKYTDPKHLPETVDQFDRLVLSDPNNSKHWINYMVFHLQSTEIDKARAVARRAIKAISFRDSNEQLNVWMALLNLEIRYGNKETYTDTLKEVLTYNDPMKVYLLTIDILRDANKTQELIEIIGIVTKKFKGELDVWRTVANAYFSIGMKERAQSLLHKALSCLSKQEHVNAIVMFANLNHKHGDNEMAQTLLEQIVTSYPKRVDVWTQYVDMLIKENFIDSARSVLERATIQKIPLKKMSTIFKKYLQFEERFGTEADVQKVKKLAAEYVKANSST